MTETLTTRLFKPTLSRLGIGRARNNSWCPQEPVAHRPSRWPDFQRGQ